MPGDARRITKDGRHAGPRRPTMADVGRRAGVSATTVSFVINDRIGQSISEATRQRVMDAVRELDYRPNRAAQGLRTRRSATIGFVTDELVTEQSMAGPAIAAAHDVAWRHRSMLLMVNTSRSRSLLQAALRDLQDRQVDTIVVAAAGTRRITLPEAPRVPTVLLNCFTAGDAVTCVLPDEVAGGRAQVEMALRAGHTEIAYLAGLPGSWATRARLRGYRGALSEVGLDHRKMLLRFGTFHVDSGFDLTRELLRDGPPPSAILCGNDRMALGTILALSQAGLRVPQDVSVVGYDDQEGLAAEIRPALSTVRLPYYEMGRWAAEHLLGQALARVPARNYVTGEVVMRDSLGPPRSHLDI